MDVILTHEHTDFDAVASQLGAAKLFPSYQPVLPHQVNRNVRDFLTLHWEALPFRRQEDLPPDVEIERILLVETQSVPAIAGLDLDEPRHVLVIDHHEQHDDLPAEWRYEGKTVGACTTIFVERMAERHVPLSSVEATLLLLGIYEDTGSLSYSGTTPLDLRAAAWLLDHGANLDVARDYLHHALSDPQRELYQQLQKNATFEEVNGYQILIATARPGRYVEEVSALAHTFVDLYDPAGLFLLVEMGDHVQIVARSTSDAVPVGRLMERFGGGGHTRAAAAVVDERPLAEVRADLVETLRQEVHPAVRVADVMSWGNIRTLEARATISKAEDLMRRRGHEGFPVVDEGGRVVGVLTRRDVDRAVQHGLGNALVVDFMHKGPITVRPDAGVETVQQIMTRHMVGQVPVVSGEPPEIVGIVTRTDLLKLWDTGLATDSPAQREIVERLRDAVPAPTLALVRTIAGSAHELDFSLYFVGGFVRDLLLGQPVKDLDLVVEGDAIELAQRLAARYGGRVVSHRRFGTARWILQEGKGSRAPILTAPELPHHIDLVTARTEFYEHPTALPQVEESSIKLDLHRRDFTINTLAIALDPDRYGALLDFYGGYHDLMERRIRVLHHLSFVDDPTRILRAVRFVERLGFELEPRTAELLLQSRDLLKRVSGDRIRHELYLIFAEPEPTRYLRRLAELEILRLIDPALRFDEDVAGRFRRVGETELTERPEYFLAMLAYDLPETARERLAERLMLSRDTRNLLRAMARLREAAPALTARDLSRSALDAALSGINVEAVELVAVATDKPELRQRLRLYLDELRQIELAVDGHDLRALGLAPGRRYAEILAALRAAKLDGRLPTPEDEQALAAKLVAAEGD